MPRHVHPHPRSKHGRAHVRHHRERAIARRWREAKNDWGTISPTLEYKTGWSRPELSGAELAEHGLARTRLLRPPRGGG
jgi:hypothetical protein